MSLPPTTIPPADEAPSPRARGRDDACPGALRLHPADDGSLARVRIPGGLLTAGQARALAGASEELGDGRLDLTSRGNLQVRGLDAACGGELAAALRAVGLLPSDRFDRVRNIVASPLGGLDGAGCGDVTAWARELDVALCSGTREELSGLSGRFLFAMDDGRGDVAALGADVTLIATRNGGAVLRVGSGAPGPESGPGADLEVRGRDAPRAAALAAVEFLARAGASGTRAWRVRELPAQHAVTADGLAARLADEGVEAVRIGRSGPVGEPGAPPAPGVVSGPDGSHAVSVLVPLGRAGAAQWRLLAGLASRGGSGELRVTPWRGVVLPGFTADGAADAAREAADAGLVTDPGSPWVGVGACTGRPGCAKSLADVRAHAARAVADAPRSPDTPQGSPDTPPVYFSGCERRCGHPGGRWVDALATSGTDYRLTVRDTREPDGATDGGTTGGGTTGGGVTGGGVTGGGVTDVAAEQLADAVATARGTA
ncbi:precorrin-3B synthase [Streptomyces sp. Rer75]|uniref:precorrin-3B synthase n=1 Tax=Streptomyces sp. Rer75 TaxID=2750011 RepID=UPI00211E7668|nr:precorrin-3B synthase [Streptomyces sp. Rer75]